jgi:AcrR family transcriptional regulator
VRKAPEETRDAIRRAALVEFCAHGYHATTLQAIAGQVGLSRGAVLHHFSTKAALLNSVVEPLLSALHELISAAHVSDPPDSSELEDVLGRLAALVLQHRHAVELLMHDIASCDQIDATQDWTTPLSQIAILLAGSRADEAERIRAMAAVGAILHPAATALLEMTRPGAQRVLTHAGFAAISPERARVPATTVRA